MTPDGQFAIPLDKAAIRELAHKWCFPTFCNGVSRFLLARFTSAIEQEVITARFDLRDFEWTVIQPLLPTKVRDKKRGDDRRVLAGQTFLANRAYDSDALHAALAAR